MFSCRFSLPAQHARQFRHPILAIQQFDLGNCPARFDLFGDDVMRRRRSRDLREMRDAKHLSLSRNLAHFLPHGIGGFPAHIGIHFIEQAKRSSAFTLASEDYHIEPFSGAHCEGSYARFRIRSGSADIIQVMFLMSVDGKLWNGQFTGTTESWTQALTVLKSIGRR